MKINNVRTYQKIVKAQRKVSLALVAMDQRWRVDCLRRPEGAEGLPETMVCLKKKNNIFCKQIKQYPTYCTTR